MSRGYYHTNDPLENFKIKVSVRQLSHTSPESTGEDADPYFHEVRTFSWQEKRWGPLDIVENLRNKETGNSSSYNSRDRSDAKSDATDSLVTDSKLAETMLYSYIDKDNFTPLKEPISYNSKGLIERNESYIATSVLASRHDKFTNDSSREKKVQDRIYREKPYKVMHVCLATDVDVATLRDKKPWNPSYFFTENLLCSITLYQDGFIETAPAIGEIISENTATHGVKIATTPSLFIDDQTVAAGIKKGFQLMTYRVRSKDGREYEYAIENVNDLINPADVQQSRIARNEADKIAVAKSRGQYLFDDDGDNWKMDAPAANCNKTIAFYCEIVSGSNFHGDNLFVTYEMAVPQGWKIRTGNLSDGAKEEDLSNEIKDGDGFIDKDEAKGVLNGSTQLSIARENSRGLSYIINRPKWKGSTQSSSFDEVTSIIVSFSFFIVTCASIVVGSSFPFWLVPSFVIIFTVLTGYPGGSAQAVILEKIPTNPTAKPKKTLVGSQLSHPVANFNHLFNASFDYKDDSTPQSVEFNDRMKILFKVYSVGWFGRYSLEGYGYYNFPDKAGSVDTEIRTWRPVGNYASKMIDHFLGNSMRLIDENFMEIPTKVRGVSSINKFGVQTETSGAIRFKCHQIICNPSAAGKNKLNLNKSSSGLLKTTQTKRTIEDILTDVRSSVSFASRGLGGTLMSSSLSSSIGGGGGGVRGLASATSALPVSDRVKDVLARVGGRSSTGGIDSSSSSSSDKINAASEVKFGRNYIDVDKDSKDDSITKAFKQPLVLKDRYRNDEDVDEDVDESDALIRRKRK